MAKVFISHASDDKGRFVLEFAGKLLNDGIDAWVDEWEMMPGDSIIDKIFNEGIKNADVFIIVISKYSIKKKWVSEELNSALISRLQENLKIIPVILDDCEIPQALKSILWVKIKDITKYDGEYARLLSAIQGQTEKPILGPQAKYMENDIVEIPGLKKIDVMVLELSCKIIKDMLGNEYIQSGKVIDHLLKQGVKKDQVLESLKYLNENHYIKAMPAMAGSVTHYQITSYGFDMFLSSSFSDYGEMQRRIAVAIANDKGGFSPELAKRLHLPHAVVRHVIFLLENKGLLTTNEMRGGTMVISTSATLSRI